MHRRRAGRAGKKLLNPSPAFYNGPMELAGLLTANSVFDRVFFANSGAEANEGAIKLARKWGKKNPAAARFEIITFDHSFHGRTLATMSASGKAGWDTMFAPQVPGFPRPPERHRQRRGADHRQDRGRDAGAGAGRRRRDPGDQGIHAGLRR
jgi:acetylornithine/succinyldiaminopimelate/putrescine aminotransferase